MSAAQGTAMGARPPITAGQLLVEIRHFHKEHHRWPTIAEMAVAIERSLDQIKDKVRILRNQGLLDKEGLHLVITDMGGGYEAPVTRTVWTKEQVEAHLRSLRVDPTPGSTKVLKTEEPPKKEETEEMGKVRMVPSDEQILADVDALKASGARGIYKTLAEQYGVPVGTVAPAIQRARLRQTANLLETAPSTMPTEADEHPAQALEQAAKQWRDRRMGRLVLVLSEEIVDDATLGKLVRRLIREGVA